MEARGFKADCGCEADLIKWSSKRNVLTMRNCPMHKAAKEMLEVLKIAVEDAEKAANPAARMFGYTQAKSAIAKAEGR